MQIEIARQQVLFEAYMQDYFKAKPISEATLRAEYEKVRQLRGDCGQRQVKLTPLTTLTFFLSTAKLYGTLARPAQALRPSMSLDAANDALHAIGIRTELDYEREFYQATKSK